MSVYTDVVVETVQAPVVISCGIYNSATNVPHSLFTILSTVAVDTPTSILVSGTSSTISRHTVIVKEITYGKRF